jgi:hypothetical protein
VGLLLDDSLQITCLCRETSTHASYALDGKYLQKNYAGEEGTTTYVDDGRSRLLVEKVWWLVLLKRVLLAGLIAGQNLKANIILFFRSQKILEKSEHLSFNFKTSYLLKQDFVRPVGALL